MTKPQLIANTYLKNSPNVAGDLVLNVMTLFRYQVVVTAATNDAIRPISGGSKKISVEMTNKVASTKKANAPTIENFMNSGEGIVGNTI